MRPVLVICTSLVLSACAVTGTQKAQVESIVFVSQRSGNGDIYALHLDDLSVTPLITNAAAEGNPVWDRARKRIVYQSFTDDGADLYAEDKRLMRDPNGDAPPSWSPDGKTLVFAADRDGNENLFLARVDGSGERRVTDGRFTDRYPSFSPDGKRLIFARKDDIGWDLHSYELATGETIRHTLDGVYVGHPAWSPDGLSVVFDRAWDEQTEIAVLNVSTGDIIRLTNRAANDLKPSFSLDGDRVVFASNADDDWDLWEINIDGNGLRQMTDSPGFDGAALFVPESLWAGFVPGNLP